MARLFSERITEKYPDTDPQLVGLLRDFEELTPEGRRWLVSWGRRQPEKYMRRFADNLARYADYLDGPEEVA